MQSRGIDLKKKGGGECVEKDNRTEDKSRGKPTGTSRNPSRPRAEFNGWAQQSRALAGGLRMDRSNPSHGGGKVCVFEEELKDVEEVGLQEGREGDGCVFWS